MNRSLLMFAACVLTVLTVSRPLRAQSGCADSPENPTLVLSGLAASAYAISQVRASKKRN